ncbi:MAG: Sigma 54 modulation protein / ribosomal protein [Verrucomicrobiota bacterium]|jgi:ribosomal subunit interface protein
MDIIVAARNFQISDKIRSLVADSLSALRSSHPKLIKADVVLTELPDKSIKAEIVLHGDKIHLDAHAEAADLHKSLALAVDRLDRQLEKRIDKIHHQQHARHLGNVEADKANQD